MFFGSVWKRISPKVASFRVSSSGSQLRRTKQSLEVIEDDWGVIVEVLVDQTAGIKKLPVTLWIEDDGDAAGKKARAALGGAIVQTQLAVQVAPQGVAKGLFFPEARVAAGVDESSDS